MCVLDYSNTNSLTTRRDFRELNNADREIIDGLAVWLVREETCVLRLSIISIVEKAESEQLVAHFSNK
jgi:hypothetical protein